MWEEFANGFHLWTYPLYTSGYSEGTRSSFIFGIKSFLSLDLSQDGVMVQYRSMGQVHEWYWTIKNDYGKPDLWPIFYPWYLRVIVENGHYCNFNIIDPNVNNQNTNIKTATQTSKY